MSEAIQRVQLEESWKQALRSEFESPYMADLRRFLLEAHRGGRRTYPPASLIFNALDLCPINQVKVVIIGQDPYINEHQAHGLCFSVPDGIQPPPSLINIFQELREDLKEIEPDQPVFQSQSGNLTGWAEQGVLLLNSTLTVQAGQSGSHQGIGWERFTDRIVQIVNEQLEHVVFMLWGNYAKRKGENVDLERHLVLTASHPSPLSAHNGFFGCRHFSLANNYLSQHGKQLVNWRAV